MLDQIPSQNQTPPVTSTPVTPPVVRPTTSAPVTSGPVPSGNPPVQNVSQMPAQPHGNKHGSPKKGIIIVLVVFLLLIGSSAAAYFTGAYLKLPFFNKIEEEMTEGIKGDLANMMYERLAQLDGADFELTYGMSVGDRDADAEAPEIKEKKKGINDIARIKSNLVSLVSIAEIYYDDNESSYDGVCVDKNIERIEKYLEHDNFTCMDDSSHWAASAKLEEGYWCIDNTGLQINSVTAIKSHTCAGLEKLEPSPVSKSDELTFLTGEYLEDSWMYIENTIPEDLEIEFKFTGSGFSLAGRDEGRQDLPDVQVGLFGKAKLSSATFELGIEAKAVADDFYYMVSDFPIMDITKGHMDEWIKISPEDGWVANIVPEYDEEQKTAVANFRKFISETQKYDVLSFRQTEKVVDVAGIKTSIFDVTVNAENIPAWLEAARKIAIESASDEEMPFLEIEKDKLTPEEEKELVENINKAMKNIKISIGIDMNKGDLMMVDMRARFIPPATSKKFEGKQFNFVVNLELSNHNNPPTIVAPEVYVDNEIIEQEELGMTDEQFQDYKQARRVLSIREKLAEYYNKKREFPADLSMVTRLDEDRNTGRPYKYSVSKGNYNLIYKMNTDIREVEGDDGVPNYDDWGLNLGGNYDSVEYKLEHTLGSNSITRDKNLWHDGENTADRYSVVIDQVHKGNEYVKDFSKEKYNDGDVLQAAHQAKIIKTTKNALQAYHTKNKKYPESILDLVKDDESRFYFHNFSGYLCEDLNTGAYCDYSVTDSGKDYEIKVLFPMPYASIDSKVNLYNYTYEVNFVEGENILTGQIVLDSDKDGLNDRDEEKYGTDKYNYDTDGDGYSDGEEVLGGYDPLSSSKSDVVTLAMEDDWLQGDVESSITIIEYSDYDCPFCQRFHGTMKQILEEYPEDVKWVYRHFPLTSLHPDAFKKAHAAECVGELGGNEAFWQFSDELYEQRPVFSELGNIVETLGYDKNTWQICMDSEKFNDKINQHIAKGQEDGAKGTPYSLVINYGLEESSISGALPFESVKSQIDKLLK